jgi:anion-transporting  ArsA/GET3 family ATPase
MVAGLDQLLAAKDIVICCGAGGVGKTTTAAALGAMAAERLGGKVLVITVDPARRLANALGLESFGNTETQVGDDLYQAAGARPEGELWAAMLDTKQSWDDLIGAHAPDAATRDAILANPFYLNITGRFVHSHDYIAMERLHDIYRSGRYDLIVVDTPPSRNAIDFLEAPQRMADFFSSRLLRWLTMPGRSRLLARASRPFYTVADRVLGSQVLEDLAEFFQLFQSMHGGFVERAEAVSRTLADPRTTFVVVSTLEAVPVREAEMFVDALSSRHLHLGGMVLNKVLPDWFRDDDAADAAAALRERSTEVAGALAGNVGDRDQVARVLAEVGDSFRNFRRMVLREDEQRRALGERTGGADGDTGADADAGADGALAVAAVPYADHDICDLAGLLELGASLWDGPTTPGAPTGGTRGDDE